jgi:hypothetical protein
LQLINNEQSNLKDYLLLLKEDITCGLHSGFPPCCIKFFITKWVWNIYSKSNRDHWKKIRRVRSFKIQYIPCPKCLKNKTFVHLKKSPKNCPKIKLVKKMIKQYRNR